MPVLFFDHAYLPAGWASDVRIETDANGKIIAVASNQPRPPLGSDGCIALPGMVNLHSHAFQRAMAGLGEWAGATMDDSFWRWRETMYRFVRQLRPEDVQAIATQAYIEMLEAGFTTVGEFHYLHHQPDGTPYDTLSEMSQRLLAAAIDTGIGQTLLPVQYQYSGFGAAPIGDGQRRFYNDPERFLLLAEACRAHATDRIVVGVAPHSLRAVSPETMQHMLDATASGPVHIHIAEQHKEVADCLAWSGARPVAWLMEQYDINSRWCLVHATHINDAERHAIAASGAVVGLCPITEANLGDGIFDGVAYQRAGGAWGIGSDSNVRIDVAEELRSYEYSQRLRDRQRNRIAAPHQATARCLFDTALQGGAQALGQAVGSLRVGQWCDVIALDKQHPALTGKQGDDWLNAWIFSGDATCVQHVWASGKHVVKDGAHIQRGRARTAYAACMDYLTNQ
jgi:formimidoylglutamate deiminase